VRSAVEGLAESLESIDREEENAGDKLVDVCVLPLVPIRMVT